MRVVNSNQFPVNDLFGNQAWLLSGDVAPDGDNLVDDVDFNNAPIGTVYLYKVTANQVELRQKIKDDKRDDDWTAQGVISQTITRAQFTDGGSTSGTKDLNASIPIGAIVTRTRIGAITGFTGDTSATLIVGVTGGDTDRYMTGTPSVFTTAAGGVDAGAVSGTAWHTAAAVPTALVTSAADFTNVAAGQVTITIWYVK